MPKDKDLEALNNSSPSFFVIIFLLHHHHTIQLTGLLCAEMRDSAAGHLEGVTRSE